MPSRGRPKHPDILTPREWEVLALLREHRTNEEIAQALAISFTTARFHVSEILGKLGVASREEAARWQPSPERSASLLAPAALSRRIGGLGATARIAAGMTLAIAAGGVALLVWGVFATGGGASNTGAWQVEGANSGYPSVVLFDLSTHVARRLPVEWDAPDAHWAKPGQTFLAGGSGASYGIYDLNGQRVSPMTQGNLTRDVVPAPDGSAVLVGRTDDQYIVSTLPKGGGGSFLSAARELAFSPDGEHAAWLGLGQLDENNKPHPSRTVFFSTASSLTGFNGNGLAVESAFDDTSLIDLAPNPWSPDSTYLLIERRAPCPGSAPNCDNPPDFEVYNTKGATGDRVWSGYKGQLSSAQWAGPARLLVTFADGQFDPQFPGSRQLLVPLFGGDKQPVPALTGSSCCSTLSFSPDGGYAIADTGTGSSERCALFDTQTRPARPVAGEPADFPWSELAAVQPTPPDASTSFCAHVDWTPDGTAALASSVSGATGRQQ